MRNSLPRGAIPDLRCPFFLNLKASSPVVLLIGVLLPECFEFDYLHGQVDAEDIFEVTKVDPKGPSFGLIQVDCAMQPLLTVAWFEPSTTVAWAHSPWQRSILVCSAAWMELQCNALHKLMPVYSLRVVKVGDRLIAVDGEEVIGDERLVLQLLMVGVSSNECTPPTLMLCAHALFST